MLSPEERFELIRQVGEEIVSAEELMELLKENRRLTAYDGFEPSGRIHIAQGLLRAITVNKLISAGVDFKFWVADWFALMNNKMGGDLEKIRAVGEYFIEVWKACGMDMKHVEFLWASERMDQEYWLRTIRIGMNNSVTRVIRTAQIMGRNEQDALSAAQIFYPCMQASDIFELGVDIAQLGMDQRKVNMLAREVAPKLGFKKPVAVHHHMLMGLTEPKKTRKIIVTTNPSDSNMLDANYGFKIRDGQPKLFYRAQGTSSDDVFNDETNEATERLLEGAAPWKLLSSSNSTGENGVTFYTFEFEKVLTGADAAIAKKMSKSNPDSAIFMTDSVDEVNRKFKKAYCPEGQVEDNPVLEYCKYIVFERVDSFVIERPEKFGGTLVFSSYDELERAFVAKQVHPMDVKAAAAKYINEFLEPVRHHFAHDAHAKKLLERVQSFT